MIPTKDGYIFESTGRKIDRFDSAFQESNGEWYLYYGYDGMSTLCSPDGTYTSSPELTPEEKTEIALVMIDHWKEFGNIT